VETARLVTPTLARAAIDFLSRKGQEELVEPEAFDC